MHILQALFRGQINSEGKTIRPGSQYEQLSLQQTAERDKFMIELSDRGKAHYKIFEEITGLMESIEAEDAFIDGFQLGVKMILAGLGDHPGQFRNDSWQ